MRILVIDDEQPTLKMFGLLLGALGHECRAAASGEEGLRLFLTEKPDVVLTDIKMPGIDGMEVLRSLKEADPRTEVIVITGHGDVDLAVAAMNLDATDFINKPVRSEDLVAALERAHKRIRLKLQKEEEIRLLPLSGDGVAVVRIRGTVSGPAEPVLRHAFEDALITGTPAIRLDFDEAVSVNGAAIATLSELVERAMSVGRMVDVTGASPTLATVLDAMGILKKPAAG